MNSDPGGLSSSDRQRQTAAEIARKKVLAAYSSTVESLKNLPASPKNAVLRHRAAANQERSQEITNTYQTPEIQQQVQPDWTGNNHQAAEYQRTPLYSSNVTQPTDYRSPDYNPAPASLPSNPTPTIAPTYDRPVEPSYADSADESINAAFTTFDNEPDAPGALKDSPINQDAISEEWQQYHSAWQDYYKNYYSDYYAKAAQTYLATEKMKNERIATGEATRTRRFVHLVPLFMIVLVVLAGLFLQYNRLIFAPIMAYISPDSGSVTTSIEAVDPTLNQAVSPEPRLIIPKLNIDVPVAFGISTSEVNAAMNQGVAQFAIPGANAMPGQIGNLVISGHSAGDIYSSNPYKFIFSGLERLENGDLIYINYNSIRYTYQMTGSKVVEPSDVAALIYETNKPMLTLITCTPLGTSRYRLLISAEQISPAYETTGTPATPDPMPDEPSAETDNTMPANEPSFFEKMWQWLFGN